MSHFSFLQRKLSALIHEPSFKPDDRCDTTSIATNSRQVLRQNRDIAGDTLAKQGMSQFSLLQREWPGVFEAAGRAEAAVHSDPRAARFYARRALELAVAWVYKHGAGFRRTEIRRVQRLVERNRERLLRSWNDYFND